MEISSLRLKIIAAAMIVNLCPLLATPAETPGDLSASQRESLEKARASIVVITGEDKEGLPVAPGIGFWIGRDLIATDNRVVQAGVRLRVRVPGQESNTLEVTSRDSYRFATILTVTTTQAAPLSLGDSDRVAVKDSVYLVTGSDANVAASEGAVKKMIAFQEKRYFQVTASISAASRGGPVMNGKGEVIGIAGESPDGKSSGFTIPAAYLTTLLRYRSMETPTGGPGAGGGMGSGKAASTGAGQGSNVPGGAAQPGRQEGSAIPTSVDTKPVALNTGRPRYTEEARWNQTQGVVNMRILIGVDGEVKQTRVTKGLPDGLIEQAIVAAQEMRFKPATLNGLAVPYWQAIQVEFNLR